MAFTRSRAAAVDVVEADLLWKLSADVALIGFIDGVQLELDHHLAAAVDEIGEGEIDVAESLLRSADDEGAGAFVDGELFYIEDVADDVAELIHLLRWSCRGCRWSPATGARSAGDFRGCLWR